MRPLLVALLVAAPFTRGATQTIRDSAACRAVIGTPTRDSLWVTINLHVRAFDPNVELTPQYRNTLALGVREMLRLPTPLPLVVYLQEPLAGRTEIKPGDSVDVVPTIAGAYALTATRNGRFTKARVVGGARATSFDAAIISALTALSDSMLAPMLPASVHANEIELRLSVNAFDSTTLRRTPLTAVAAEPLFRVKLPRIGRGTPVGPVPGNTGPRYPVIARNNGVEGKVQLTFVVDADGHGDLGSIQASEATASEFVTSVIDAFPGLRFKPLTVRGCTLAALIAMPFEFSLIR